MKKEREKKVWIGVWEILQINNVWIIKVCCGDWSLIDVQCIIHIYQCISSSAYVSFTAYFAAFNNGPCFYNTKIFNRNRFILTYK